MADGTQEWTEFTLPTSPLLGPDTITEPTAEYDAPDVTYSVPAPISLTIAVVPPIYIARYDNPSSIAATLTVNQPTTNIQEIVQPTPVAMTITVNAPTPRIRKTEGNVGITGTVNAAIPTPTATPADASMTGTVYGPIPTPYSTPATVAGSLTVNAPVLIITQIPNTVGVTGTVEAAIPTPTGTPAEVSMIISPNAPTPEARVTAATINMSLTVNQPTVNVGTRRVGANELQLRYHIWFDPKRGSMAPTIVRHIADPVVTGGCPQCGAFRYKHGGDEVSGETVKRGRNFDLDKGRREDRYVRCGRGGFILHKDRHVSLPDGAKAGWGMKYEEQEIEESWNLYERKDHGR